MSFSSEVKEWAVAIKELWQEEHRKHPNAIGSSQGCSSFIL
jgi:hypothetical protein